MNGNRIMTAIICVFASFTMALTVSSGSFAQETQETIEHEAGFYYTIQKGDTLWDISDQFFDSAWLWPELWQENDQIPNPHWIYPGERIRLYQNKGSDTFTLEAPEDENLAVESASDTQLDNEPVQEEEKETVYYLYPSMEQVGFITKDEIKPLGLIFENKDNMRLVDQGDTVYITYEEEDADKLMPGSQYTIYRELPPTKDRKRNKQLGSQYYILGRVEIVNKEVDFVAATVVASYRAINKDDFILPYKRRSPRIAIQSSPEGMKGKIVLSEEHLDLMGDFMLAFIDKGSEDNIKPGQQYSIYHQQEGMKNNKKILYTPVDYGTFIVLHTEKYISTVLIIQTDYQIEPGATFRTPIDQN